MKIFPIIPMSKLDVFIELCKIMPQKTLKQEISKPDIAVINNTVKTLKKGRSICDKLSE